MRRAGTNRGDGLKRELRFIDVNKAHLNPNCSGGVYVVLPDESGRSSEVCEKLQCWFYGFRKQRRLRKIHSRSISRRYDLPEQRLAECSSVVHNKIFSVRSMATISHFAMWEIIF